jgi:hypothetical protein
MCAAEINRAVNARCHWLETRRVINLQVQTCGQEGGCVDDRPTAGPRRESLRDV